MKGNPQPEKATEETPVPFSKGSGTEPHDKGNYPDPQGEQGQTR